MPFDPASCRPRIARLATRPTAAPTLPIGAAAAARRARPTASARRPAPRRPTRAPGRSATAAIAPRPSPALAAAVAGAFDRASYGTGAKTTGVVVLRDGAIVAERYADGFGPFIVQPHLVGRQEHRRHAGRRRAAAAARRHDARARLADWEPRRRPARAASRSTSCCAWRAACTATPPATAPTRSISAARRSTEQATGWPLEAAPGTRFRYANNDILLAVLRAARDDRRRGATHALPARALFAPLGMRHTVAETDWHGNYILSSQVWSTARDLARLGQFWLQDGVWQGKRLLPEGWMRYMTTPSRPAARRRPRLRRDAVAVRPEAGPARRAATPRRAIAASTSWSIPSRTPGRSSAAARTRAPRASTSRSSPPTCSRRSSEGLGRGRRLRADAARHRASAPAIGKPAVKVAARRSSPPAAKPAASTSARRMTRRRC